MLLLRSAAFHNMNAEPAQWLRGPQAGAVCVVKAEVGGTV